MHPNGHDEKLKQLQLDIAAAEALYKEETTGERQNSVEIKPEAKTGLVLTNPNKNSENLYELKARKSMNTQKVSKKPLPGG